MKCHNFMRRILLCLLSFLLLGSILLTSCAPKGDVTEESTTVAADTGGDETDGHEENKEDEELKKKLITLNSETPGVKVLGVRHLRSNMVINCDWSNSGIEFVATCEGNVLIRLATNNPCYFRVFVDGEAWKNGESDYFEINGKDKMISLTKIPRGTHTFRIVRVTGYLLAQAHFTSISLTGYLHEDAVADKDTYIEFVGDSITCGWGVIGTHDGKYSSQDGTLAYPYLLASELDADYSMTALSGQGICVGNPGVSLGYRYACYGKDSTTEYDFARKADMVMVNIGTNDCRTSNNISEATFREAFLKWVEYVREKNGDDCKILAVYNMMADGFADQIISVFDSLGGEQAGFYTWKAERSSDGIAGSHPSAAEHAVYATKLLPVVRAILNGEGMPKPEEDTKSTMPKNTVVVGTQYASMASGTVVDVTLDGNAYRAVVGSTAFGTIAAGHDALAADGTMYLLAGKYSGNFQIQKNMTILGPKAGIDPNQKGSAPTDNWTRNPQRGTGEAILTGNVGMGVWNTSLYSNCHKIVIDGVQLSENVLLRHNNGGEGYNTVEMRNILVKDVTQTNFVFYFYPYYPTTNNPNLYERTLIVENLRVEGNLNRSLMRLACVSFEASGIYMSADCTQGLINAIGTTSKTEGCDTFVVRDSQFRNAKATVLSLDMRSDTEKMGSLASGKKMDITVTRCAFIADASVQSHSAWILILRNNTAASVHITDNTMISSSASNLLISDAGSKSGQYAAVTEIARNSICGRIDLANATDAQEILKDQSVG